MIRWLSSDVVVIRDGVSSGSSTAISPPPSALIGPSCCRSICFWVLDGDSKAGADPGTMGVVGVNSVLSPGGGRAGVLGDPADACGASEVIDVLGEGLSALPGRCRLGGG